MQSIEWCFDLIAAASVVSVTDTTYSVPSPHSESSGRQGQIPSHSTECSCDLSVILVKSRLTFSVLSHLTSLYCPSDHAAFPPLFFGGITYVPQKFKSQCAPIHRFCYMFLLKDFFLLYHVN